MDNVNDRFFDGHYKDIWRAIIPEELNQKELEFMVPYFSLAAGSRVLDLMCGYGRHALALGRKGIAVTAVDNLPAYTDEIRRVAEAEQLPVEAVTQPVQEFVPEGTYDLAICMGNSLNFFNRTDTVSILARVAAVLKPGGQLLINTWSLLEIVLKSHRDKSWSQVGDLLFLTDMQLRFQPARIDTTSIIIAPDGSREIREGVDYIYSLNEMEAMLQEAGLELLVVYSIPGRKKFAPGEPRAYVVAKKPV
jgi:SAM-dependent methyltransferase